MDDLVILSPKRPHEERKKDLKTMKSMDDDLLVLPPERILEEVREEEEDDKEDVKRIKPYSKKTMAEFDIGNDCHVSVQNYEGNIYIHIRYFDTTPRGKPYPTKKA